MIAKSPKRDTFVGRSFDIARGSLGLMISPLTFVFYSFEESFLPLPLSRSGDGYWRIIEEPDSLNLKHMKEYIQRREKMKDLRVLDRFVRYCSNQRARISGRDVEYKTSII